ncbi:MAG: hypothetical protein GY754_10100 [bacterium]|nr:hypothetical protein [bacterium]
MAKKKDTIKAEEPDKLSPLMERPKGKVLFGIILVGISYILGWPAVGFFGFLAAYLEEPLVAAIGGPAIYGFSHVLFWWGLYLAGKDYAKAFFDWALKKGREKFSRSKNSNKKQK